MQILFLHDNFPAQFGQLGEYLARKGWDVWFGTQRAGAASPIMKVFNYKPHRKVTEKIHRAVAGYESAVLNGQAVARAALALKQKGLDPDIVMAHSGWGAGLFVKDIWPRAKYVGYFEWYYHADAPDMRFQSGSDPSLDELVRTRARNAAILADLVSCDAGICPTQFQKSQFPAALSGKLAVMHDGIDAEYHAPAPGARFEWPGAGQVEELVTYVARGMEPYRGFPEFIKALEILLAERPKTHVAIVGEDRVAYGAKLPEGDSYKQRALRDHQLDWSRVHFTGLLPRAQYLKVLQASNVHTYLTIPFVLSWSMMEAMSAGCAVVASDVAAVREIADHDPSALRLVNMREPSMVAKAITGLLDTPAEASLLGTRARQTVLQHYNAKDILPRKERLLSELVG